MDSTTHRYDSWKEKLLPLNENLKSRGLDVFFWGAWLDAHRNSFDDCSNSLRSRAIKDGGGGKTTPLFAQNFLWTFADFPKEAKPSLYEAIWLGSWYAQLLSQQNDSVQNAKQPTWSWGAGETFLWQSAIRAQGSRWSCGKSQRWQLLSCSDKLQFVAICHSFWEMRGSNIILIENIQIFSGSQKSPSKAFASISSSLVFFTFIPFFFLFLHRSLPLPFFLVLSLFLIFLRYYFDADFWDTLYYYFIFSVSDY